MRDIFTIRLTDVDGDTVYVSTHHIGAYLEWNKGTRIVMVGGENVDVQETVEQINKIFKQRAVLTCLNEEPR